MALVSEQMALVSEQMALVSEQMALVSARDRRMLIAFRDRLCGTVFRHPPAVQGKIQIYYSLTHVYFLD